MALEPEIHLEVLGNFTNKTLEGQHPNQEFITFLIFPNLMKSNSSGVESMQLLHSTSGRCRLSYSLGASCFLGAFPLVDLQVVYSVCAMSAYKRQKWKFSY